MSNLLEIKNLSYRINQKLILREINLEVQAGHFIALAGENGIGKTTLLRLIASVAKNYRGEITIDGKTKPEEKKTMVSFSDQLEGFSKRTKIRDIEKFYSQVYPDFSEEKFDEIAAFLDVDCNNNLSSLSKGMKERLVIALTLSRQVALYLLDEPFSGIDVMSRDKIIKGLLTWVDENSTVIVSSHHLSEIENVVDEIIIMKDYGIYEHVKTDDIRNEQGKSIEEYFENIYWEDK
ncbi:ABC transporter ATP-binding protein [Companilactobacillus sp. RD055328]|uniref:ATP-binding cassette domain-containing protein n=1 Tax=Companilactobacillus sp. RD055328 TaxID=2916634 RepID=UPI001FC7E218|nr:ABC transporter ATP-binding protein [Companilactobacillus sp. RD055328]GKQ42773.1 ABC transporter ATP-binding protein [Companilactobacillus sp. RD055328]